MQHTTLDRTAADRGTALHRAIRVFLTRPDLRRRLPAATGLDPATLLALETQTTALRDWLTRTGYPRIACELPIEARHPDGSGFNGVIDLLATGPAGQLILDHKSGSGCFADHLPQLLAYRNPLQAQTGPIPTSLAIHWIDRASIEIAVKTTHNRT